jgi:starch synthase
MKVVSICAERAPFARTGGLGDVTAALPEALLAADPSLDHVTVLPLYGASRPQLQGRLRPAGRFLELVDDAPYRTLFFEHPAFETPGLYDGPEEKFGGFCRAVVDAFPDADVFHLHDWHAAHAATLTTTRTVLTLHNLAYQGPFLRDGIAAADVITTVSVRYAEEIQTEAFGCGLHGLLAERGVIGILNGIAKAEPPERDREGLLSAAGLSGSDVLFGVVSRLDWHKGLDWVADVIPRLETLPARLVLLGTGDPKLEARFTSLASDRFFPWLCFDPARADQILAGADALLVPSRFEPCGLTQLYAMRAGTVPVVNPVGGLADTVTDPGRGFRMTEASPEGLYAAMSRAVSARKTPAWERRVENGRRWDSSWRRSAERYLEIFAG